MNQYFDQYLDAEVVLFYMILNAALTGKVYINARKRLCKRDPPLQPSHQKNPHDVALKLLTAPLSSVRSLS